MRALPQAAALREEVQRRQSVHSESIDSIARLQVGGSVGLQTCGGPQPPADLWGGRGRGPLYHCTHLTGNHNRVELGPLGHGTHSPTPLIRPPPTPPCPPPGLPVPQAVSSVHRQDSEQLRQRVLELSEAWEQVGGCVGGCW